jgi:hypothetical protein
MFTVARFDAGVDSPRLFLCETMGRTLRPAIHASGETAMTLLAQAPAMQSSPSTTWIIVAVIVVLAIVLLVAMQRRRSQRLHDRFGPEYERTVAETGSRQRAEAELAARERRHRSLEIQPLPPGARDRYAEEWRTVQARFVDAPGPAVGDADRLVSSVMRDRGYPMADFDQRVDDLSVEHANVVDNYRVARGIAQKNDRGEATTEDLRQAMVAYRALFDDLLGTDATPKARTIRGEESVRPRDARTRR